MLFLRDPITEVAFQRMCTFDRLKASPSCQEAALNTVAREALSGGRAKLWAAITGESTVQRQEQKVTQP